MQEESAQAERQRRMPACLDIPQRPIVEVKGNLTKHVCLWGPEQPQFAHLETCMKYVAALQVVGETVLKAWHALKRQPA